MFLYFCCIIKYKLGVFPFLDCLSGIRHIPRGYHIDELEQTGYSDTTWICN